jgi:hypothetical protein
MLESLIQLNGARRDVVSSAMSPSALSAWLALTAANRSPAIEPASPLPVPLYAAAAITANETTQYVILVFLRRMLDSLGDRG